MVADAARSDYMRALHAYARAHGNSRARLRRKASRLRLRMIGRNRKHAADETEPKQYGKLKRGMPRAYKKLLAKLKGKGARKALDKYRKFWGIPYPTNIQAVKSKRGTGTRYLVGMGVSPAVSLANGPRGKATKVKRLRGKRVVATDAAGRKIYVLASLTKPIGKNKRFVGYAPVTEYIPTRDMEAAGTFKKGRHWVHEHHDEGGKWPKVFKDSSGNFIYGRGTYRIGKWIRK